MLNVRFVTNIPRICGVILLTLATSCVSAQETITDNLIIPIVENAKVFAKFSDESPAVANYFSALSESDIINFYRQYYGAPIKEERKRGRLTLHFTQSSSNVRVIISPQNSLRQVDILVESKKAK